MKPRLATIALARRLFVNTRRYKSTGLLKNISYNLVIALAVQLLANKCTQGRTATMPIVTANQYCELQCFPVLKGTCAGEITGR